jgi:hypothetical protein
MRTQRGDGMLGLLWHSAQLGWQRWPWYSFLLETGFTPGLPNADRRNTSLVTFWVQYSYLPGLKLRLPLVRSSNSCGDDVANLWDCHNCFGQFRFSIRKKRPQPVAVFWLSYNTEVTLSCAFMAWDGHSGCFSVSTASCVGHFCSAKCTQPPVEVLIQVY